MFNRKLKMRIWKLERKFKRLEAHHDKLARDVGYSPHLRVPVTADYLHGRYEQVSFSHAIGEILACLKLSFMYDKGTPPRITLVKKGKGEN